MGKNAGDWEKCSVCKEGFWDAGAAVPYPHGGVDAPTCPTCRRCLLPSQRSSKPKGIHKVLTVCRRCGNVVALCQCHVRK